MDISGFVIVDDSFAEGHIGENGTVEDTLPIIRPCGVSATMEVSVIHCPGCMKDLIARELLHGARCNQCLEIIISKQNVAGASFTVGDLIYFTPRRSPPTPGVVMSFPDENSVVVRYQDTAWKFPQYDETKSINDIATTLDELMPKNQRRQRSQKVERFSDIQLVLRDGEKTPCPVCQFNLLCKASKCTKCNTRIRTSAYTSGVKLTLGQTVYFRNKLGDMQPGVLVKIVDTGVVELQYCDPQWSSPRYNETHPVGNVASSLEELLQQLGSRKRAAPRDFASASIEYEQELQRCKQERAKELAELRMRETERMAEIKRKEIERENRARAQAAAKAQRKVQRQKEREKAREKKRKEKEKDRECLKKMDHYERNRFKRLVRGGRPRKDKDRKKDKDGNFVSTVYFINSESSLQSAQKFQALSESEQQLKVAKKQAVMLEEARPCTLQLAPWVTDYVCANLAGPENEHNTFCFRPRERGRNINVSIKSMSISQLLRRVRFIEECSAKIHCGLSRLDRWEQRAMCHYIYNNTQPHRMSKGVDVGIPNRKAASIEIPSPVATPTSKVAPVAQKGVPIPRALKQLQTGLKQYIDLPALVGTSKLRYQRSTTAKIPARRGFPFGGQFRNHLADVDCSLLSIAVLERVLWACPTTENEFFALFQSYELLRSPVVPVLLELINDFLSLKKITPSREFAEVVNVNKSLELVNIISLGEKQDVSTPDNKKGPQSNYYSVPLHCALCPQVIQSEQDRVHPKYTQGEFNKIKASFPLTVSQFIFALNVAYERCGGRAKLEGCTPAQLTIGGGDGG